MAIACGGRIPRMNSRALLLVGAVLALPSWSQEPAASTPAPAHLVVDLSNESIKKIVRDTAATQSATVQISEEKPVARKSVADIVFAPPVAKPPVSYAVRLP